MKRQSSTKRIPDEVLAEQWYALLHRVISQLQSVYRREAKESGLTQKIIAKRLGLKNPEVISRCISGQRNMTLRTLNNLARAMDCRLDISVARLADLQASNRSSHIQAMQNMLDEDGSGSNDNFYRVHSGEMSVSANG